MKPVGPALVRQTNALRDGHNMGSVLPAYVYFVSDGKYTKIGASIRPEERQKQCGIDRTTLLFALFVPMPQSGYAVERAIHLHFADKRVPFKIGKRSAKEWFNLSADDIDSIKRLVLYCFDSCEDTRMSYAFCECHPPQLLSAAPRKRVCIGLASPKSPVVIVQRRR